VLYSYRARWYLPEAGVFGERDPVGAKQSPDLYLGLGDNPIGMVDPTGLQNWVETDAVQRSEELKESHNKLAAIGLTSHIWAWYKYGDTFASNGVLEIRFMGSSQGQDYPQAIVGGPAYPDLMDRLNLGTWVITPGQPPDQLSGPSDFVTRNSNIMWQRMRLFQLERMVDILWAEANSEGAVVSPWHLWPTTQRLTWPDERFLKEFPRAHMYATKQLLAKEAGNTVVSALVAANGDAVSHGLLMWLQRQYGAGLAVNRRPPTENMKAFPPWFAVRNGESGWWWHELGPASR